MIYSCLPFAVGRWPLRYSVQGYLSEIVRFVSLMKPRGKITAPTNFAEIYIIIIQLHFVEYK